MKNHKIIGWLVEQCALQTGRLFLWAPVFFGAGIGIYFSLRAEPGLWVAVPLMLACAGLISGFRNRPAILPLFIILLLTTSGFFAAQVRTHVLYAPVLHKKLGPVEISGTVEAVEDLEAGKGSRIVLYDPAIEKLAPERVPAKIRLTMRKEEDFTPGQRVKLLAQLNPPSPPVAPGAFDFQRYLYFQRIGAVGFIYKKLEIVSEPSVAQTDYIENLRNAIGARMEKVLSPGAAPMAIAFTTGERTAISESDNEAMRNSGLYHLVSISGLHIGIFSAFVFFVTRFLMACVPGMALKYPIKKYAAALGFLAAAFYTVLAGASIPTERSLIMTGLVYLAIILDRSPLSLRLIAFAALAVLVATPESLISVSFQMSFAAVAALIIFYDWARPWWSAWNRGSGFIRKAALYFAGVCLTTIIATIATGPFSLFQFQNLAIYGLIGNALAVPLTSFVIMPAIVISLVLMPLHLEFIPLQVLDRGMALLLDIAHRVAELPHSVLHVSAWPMDALPVLCAGMIFMGLWKGPLRVLGLLPVVFAVFMVVDYRPPDILISNEFDLAAYRAEDGKLHVSGRRKNKFSIESWEQMAGLQQGSAVAWPREGTERDMACDEKACRLEMKGHRVSFLKKPVALQEECAWAELVVSFPVIKNAGCEKAVLLHKFDGLKNGAYAVWLEPAEIRVETAQDERGDRPWSE